MSGSDDSDTRANTMSTPTPPTGPFPPGLAGTGQTPRSPVSVMAPAPGIQPPCAYVNFAAEVNPATTETLIAVMAQFASQRIPEVHLLLSTPGGSVMHGITIYNVLRGMPFRLITHNVGSVNSIGNAIFLAGEHRYACSNSTFMFHGVGFDVTGNVRFEEKLLRERLDAILTDQNRIGAIIESRTRLPKSEIDQLFLVASTKDANFALANGLIEEIRDVNLLPGCPVAALVFKR